MRHHAQTIVGPDFDFDYDYFPTREAALKSPPPKPPGFVEPNACPHTELIATTGDTHGQCVKCGQRVPKAERSAVERLGEVAYEAWHGTTTHSPFDRMPPLTQRDFCKAAQAVRLAVLEEPITDEDADKALLEWMRRPSQEKSQASMKHALSAALASRLARARKEGGGG